MRRSIPPCGKGSRSASAGALVLVLSPLLFPCLFLYGAEHRARVRVVPLRRDIERRFIFNGKDLEGWTVIGPNRWAVEDGELVGAGAKNAPGWLLYPLNERETTISLQFKIHDDGNSAVAVRIPGSLKTRLPSPEGSTGPSLRSLGGYTVNIAPIGTQFEPTGTIVGVSRAYPPAPTKDTVPFMFPNDWNHLILMVSRHLIRVSLNGYVVADAFDRDIIRGDIALRLPDKVGTIRFREMLLAVEHLPANFLEALSKTPHLEEALNAARGPWINLLDEGGLDLVGTDIFPRDEALITRAPVSEPTPWILSREFYRNFILEFEIFLAETAEARIVFGFRSAEQGTASPSLPYQVALNCSKAHELRHAGGSLCDLARAYPGLLKPNDWNRCAIYRRGNEIAVSINGQRASCLLGSYRASKRAEGPPLPRRAFRGRVGLRVLHGTVHFRSMRIKDCWRKTLAPPSKADT